MKGWSRIDAASIARHASLGRAIAEGRATDADHREYDRLTGSVERKVHRIGVQLRAARDRLALHEATARMMGLDPQMLAGH